MQLNAKLFVASILGVLLLFASAYFVAALTFGGPSYHLVPSDDCVVPMIFNLPSSGLEVALFNSCAPDYKCPPAPTGKCTDKDTTCKETDNPKEWACSFTCTKGVWGPGTKCSQNMCSSTTKC